MCEPHRWNCRAADRLPPQKSPPDSGDSGPRSELPLFRLWVFWSLRGPEGDYVDSRLSGPFSRLELAEHVAAGFADKPGCLAVEIEAV